MPDGVSAWRVKSPLHEFVLPRQCKCSSVWSFVFHHVHVNGFGWPLLHLLYMKVEVCPAEISPSTAPEQSATQRRSMCQKTIGTICAISCPSQRASKHVLPSTVPRRQVCKCLFHPIHRHRQLRLVLCTAWRCASRRRDQHIFKIATVPTLRLRLLQSCVVDTFPFEVVRTMGCFARVVSSPTSHVPPKVVIRRCRGQLR